MNNCDASGLVDVLKASIKDKNIIIAELKKQLQKKRRKRKRKKFDLILPN